MCLAAVALWGQSESAEQLFHEAVAAQQHGDNKVAIEKYQALVKLHPEAPEVRGNLGAALAHEGRYDEAVQQYRAALEKVPTNAQLRLNLALAYYKKGDLPQATAELTVLHGNAPADVRVATLLGDCYLRAGRFADVVTLLQPIADADPGVRFELGTALIRVGKLREGLDLVQKAAEQGQSAEAYQLAADTYLKMNEFERGISLANAAVKLNPKLPGLMTLSGRLKQYMGDYTGAKADLRQGIVEDPNDFEAHVVLAAILNGERDLDGAQEQVNRALALRPDATLARYELARIEKTRGDVKAAVADFEKVVAADPNWLRPHVELATLYYKVNRPQDGEKERATVERLQKEGVQQPPEAPSEQSPSR
jgi:tetratricopeptide (TPR) repeat protein